MALRAPGVGRIHLASLPELPELQLAGHLRLEGASDWRIPPQRHRFLEVCYLRQGAVTWWAGSALHDLGEGSLFLTFPNEPHGGSLCSPTGCDLYWIQVALPGLELHGAEFLGLPAAEAGELVAGLWNL